MNFCSFRKEDENSFVNGTNRGCGIPTNSRILSMMLLARSRKWRKLQNTLVPVFAAACQRLFQSGFRSFPNCSDSIASKLYAHFKTFLCDTHITNWTGGRERRIVSADLHTSTRTFKNFRAREISSERVSREIFALCTRSYFCFLKNYNTSCRKFRIGLANFLIIIIINLHINLYKFWKNTKLNLE